MMNELRVASQPPLMIQAEGAHRSAQREGGLLPPREGIVESASFQAIPCSRIPLLTPRVTEISLVMKESGRPLTCTPV